MAYIRFTEWRATGPSDESRTVAFSPDSRSIAIGYGNGALRLYDIGSGALIRDIKGKLPKEGGMVTALTFSPDGKFLACGYAGGAGNVFDAETGAFKSYINTGVESLAYSRDGRLLAAGGTDLVNGNWRATLSIWDAKTGRRRLGLQRGLAGRAMSVAFSPNARTLVTASEMSMDPHLTLDEQYCQVSAWDTRSGKLRWTQRERGTATPSAAYSPGGTTVATISGGDVRLRDARTGRLWFAIAPATDQTPRPCALAYSPNGNTLLIGTNFGGVDLRNARTRELINTLIYPSDTFLGLVALARSNDGNFIATANADYTVTVWDLRFGQIVQSLGRKYTDACCSFS